ncbi:MAG: Transglycosylase domain [Pseudomonadota bacterium]
MPSFYDTLDPAVRQQMDAYRPTLDSTADQYGVPRDFVYGTINRESSGNPAAIGDHGVARGPWQVQTPYMQDWLGAGPDVRHDPVKSTERIMPAFRKNLDKAGGDWGLATIGYMQGVGSDEYKRIKDGEDPGRVLSKKQWVLAAYNSMRSNQGRAGVALPHKEPGAPKPAPTQPTGQPQQPMMAAGGGIPALGIPAQPRQDPMYGVVQGPNPHWIRQGPRG